MQLLTHCWSDLQGLPAVVVNTAHIQVQHSWLVLVEHLVTHYARISSLAPSAVGVVCNSGKLAGPECFHPSCKPWVELQPCGDGDWSDATALPWLVCAGWAS